MDDSRFLPLKLFARQFASPLVLILVVAAIIAFGAGLVKDVYLIAAILVLNATLGFWQEFKAEKAISALKKITIAQTRVVRDGQEKEIPNRELVPGDLILISEGQIIPADAVVLPEFTIEVNESALTGESLPVLKTGGDDEVGAIFMGTTATSGKARAAIIETGMRTRFGNIARELKAVKDEPTPFQKSISRLSRVLGTLALIAAAFVYLAGVSRGLPSFEVFLIAASLAVAAVPEGLPTIVGLTLAVGVERLANKKAVIRRMSAVEALGAVTVICTDKTGTITTGNMRVRHIWFDGKGHAVADLRSEHVQGSYLEMLRAAILSNTATLVMKEEHGSYNIIGTPTDGSLLVMAAELGKLGEIRETGKNVQEFGFDKTIKLITAVCEVEGNLRGYIRGAPERILVKSSRWLTKDGIKDIDDGTREKLIKALDDFAGRGFRVVGFGFKNLSERKVYGRAELEQDLVYIGFVAIADPPRPEVKISLKKAEQAGVKTIMLTGDNILTARAIADEVEMLKAGDEVLLGEQIDELTDAELDEFIFKVRIVARATPEQKLRMIKSLQRRGEIVAVTGDGVNDALALKQADVGVAMGITGTDVAKESSDIILTNDQYPTIIDAIEEGRRIDDNLTKVVHYLVAGNMSEVLTVFVAVAAGFSTPLLPVQILWVNIVTDALPAFALAVGSGDGHAMHRSPKTANDHPLNYRGLRWVISASVVIAALTLFAFLLILPRGIEAARTAAFTTLILTQMIMAWVVAYVNRGKRSVWKTNRWLLLAIAGTFIVQLLLLVIPSLRQTFHLVLP